MATTVVSPYYKEHETHDYLSKTFESNVLHTPGDISRRTTSQENYVRQRACETEQFRTPWGRKYSYGGVNIVQLPSSHRPKGEPPIRMQKGTHHFGSVISAEPRGIPVQHSYRGTMLWKSKTRANDELIPSPTKVDVSKSVINAKFPEQHPYASHQSSRNTNVIPTFEKLDKRQPLSAETPAETNGFAILEKTRGSYGRHEITRIPLNSERKPMTWPGGPTYYKILKSSNRDSRVYYPIPSHTDNDPNKTYPCTEYPNTVDTMKQLRLSQWQTCYQRDYNRDNLITSQNLDNNETLVKVTAGRNARVPKSLMESIEDGRETVEDITGEKDRRKRFVHFEKLLQGSHELDNSNKNQITEYHKVENRENNARIFPLPIMKSSISLTSLQSNSDSINHGNATHARSEIPKSLKVNVSAVQDWSRSDLIRKFNCKHYNEEETNFYDKSNEKGCHVPQSNYVTTKIFS